MNRLYTASTRYSWRQKLPFPQISCKKLHFFNNHHYHNYTIQLSHASLLHKLRETKPLQQIHTQVIVSNLSHNLFLCNRLVNAYASCGLITEAQIIFSQIHYKNLVSWTILVSGLTKNGHFLEAIEAFYEMVVQEIKPNEITIASVLPAFGNLGDPLLGKSLHCYWIRQNLEDNVFVETGFVDMYAKFGCLSVARYLFDEMSMRNVVSWNVIISGYFENGYGEEALWMFNRMRRKGFSGLQIFDQMIEIWNIVPSSKHYACVIDLLARAGRLNDAYSLMKNMNTQPGIEVYGRNQALVQLRLMEKYSRLWLAKRTIFTTRRLRSF
ncbi:hypothetical protein ACJIZ3_015454 [Penstemon smallii]|uniref:Pentatricopeptide repeat-containing protein n=1 Tax=Penstemon smallii TaxID=265156 RepID=A0ABD3RQW6_9LAMI